MSARGRALRWSVFAVIVGGWTLVAETGLVRHRALAGPIQVAHALWASAADGTLAADVSSTLGRVLASVGIGLVLGAPIGLALGRTNEVSRALESWLDFLRAVPPLLVLPVFLLALGYGDSARIAVASWAAALVVSLHVAAGLRAADPARERVLRALGATRWQRVRWVRMYELLPHALVGLRQATTTAIVVCVVTEMIVGAEHGLGARALAAQISYDAPGLYLAILATGTIGLGISRILVAIERRWVGWAHRELAP